MFWVAFFALFYTIFFCWYHKKSFSLILKDKKKTSLLFFLFILLSVIRKYNIILYGSILIPLYAFYFLKKPYYLRLEGYTSFIILCIMWWSVFESSLVGVVVSFLISLKLFFEELECPNFDYHWENSVGCVIFNKLHWLIVVLTWLTSFAPNSEFVLNCVFLINAFFFILRILLVFHVLGFKNPKEINIRTAVLKVICPLTAVLVVAGVIHLDITWAGGTATESSLVRLWGAWVHNDVACFNNLQYVQISRLVLLPEGDKYFITLQQFKTSGGMGIQVYDSDAILKVLARHPEINKGYILSGTLKD